MSYQTTVKERVFYSTYLMGQNMIYAMVTGYLLLFYTDYIFLPPLAVAVLMFVSKIWDAINDPLFGMIVDRYHFKSGKFIPWVRIGTVLLPLATLFLFIVPVDASMTSKILMVSLGYLIWDMLYTVSDLPFYALTTVMTDNAKERSNIINYSRLGAGLGFAVVGIAVPILVEKMGFLIPALVVAGISYITMLPITFTAKERIRPPQRDAKQKIDFKEMWNYLKGNKFLLIAFAGISLRGSFMITFEVYVAKYCLGSLTYLTYMNLIAMVPSVLVILALPTILHYVDKIVLYKASLVLAAATIITIYFTGWGNIVLFMALWAVYSLANAAMGTMMFMFTPDCVEYGHYKTGIRKEGLTFSIQTFSAKLSAAIAGTLSGSLLVWMSYDAQLAVQPASTPEIFWTLFCWVPVIGMALSFVVLSGYKLRDRDVQVMTDCNMNRMSKEEATAQLSRTY